MTNRQTMTLEELCEQLHIALPALDVRVRTYRDRDDQIIGSTVVVHLPEESAPLDVLPVAMSAHMMDDEDIDTSLLVEIDADDENPGHWHVITCDGNHPTPSGSPAFDEDVVAFVTRRVTELLVALAEHHQDLADESLALVAANGSVEEAATKEP